MEEWRAIKGYGDRYEVSSLGRVRSLHRTVLRNGHPLTMPGRIMKISPHIKTGYNLVRLSIDGKASRLCRVNRLVCTAFEGEPLPGQQAAHGNGIRTDDCASNLCWKTRLENEADKLIHGTRPFGVAVHNATLTEVQVNQIRALRRGGWTYMQIARHLKIKFEAVRGVCARGHYADVREAA